MATTKENNVKANNVNNNNESANVSNESAKVKNESNESNATTNNATAPTAEQIAAAKVETKNETVINKSYKLEEPKEVEKTKFAGAYVLGVYRVDESKKEKKSGDKTFYKIYYSGKIYDGWHSTEFCDEVGIERKHRDGTTTKKESTLLDKLQALKNAIEAIDSTESDFVNFAKIVAKKIESEQLESQRAEFVAKYAAAIALFSIISEAACARIYGADMVALAKKLGYKFADTPTDKATDNEETTESK